MVRRMDFASVQSTTAIADLWEQSRFVRSHDRRCHALDGNLKTLAKQDVRK